MKKILIALLLIILILGVIGGGFYLKQFFEFKKIEKETVEYIMKEKNIKEKDIKTGHFLSSMAKPKNKLIVIKIKGDKNYYYYYKDNNRIKLAYYIYENDHQH